LLPLALIALNDGNVADCKRSPQKNSAFFSYRSKLTLSALPANRNARKQTFNVSVNPL